MPAMGKKGTWSLGWCVCWRAEVHPADLRAPEYPRVEKETRKQKRGKECSSKVASANQTHSIGAGAVVQKRFSSRRIEMVMKTVQFNDILSCFKNVSS
jgi:hypothetical protein